MGGNCSSIRWYSPRLTRWSTEYYDIVPMWWSFQNRVITDAHILTPTLLRFRVQDPSVTGFIQRLLQRQDLTSMYRADMYSHMLLSKTTKKNECQERLVAYGQYLLAAIATVLKQNAKVHVCRGLKINYYSLNPRLLVETSGLTDPQDRDNEPATLHVDMTTQTEIMALTFCMVRGVHGYTNSMGKQLLFTRPRYTVQCNDDGDLFYDLHIFSATDVEHGSTVWNTNHPMVQAQFAKCRLPTVPDEPDSPGRMSISMPVLLHTCDKPKTWTALHKWIARL